MVSVSLSANARPVLSYRVFHALHAVLLIACSLIFPRCHLHLHLHSFLFIPFTPRPISSNLDVRTCCIYVQVQSEFDAPEFLARFPKPICGLFSPRISWILVVLDLAVFEEVAIVTD